MSDDIPANERYIISGSKRLRCGFTTGTCAALAAQAATVALLTGELPERVTLRTPKGWLVHASPIAADGARAHPNAFRCGIRKDAGDDPDVTDGCVVYATVTLSPVDGAENVAVTIDGGAGVGRVTKAGLDQAVGRAAINRVPRTMIADAVRKACEAYCFAGAAHVVIDVPQGAELAARTFNPHLGITGGISILGTSGVVEPMSEAAIIETIDAELCMRAAEYEAREKRETAMADKGDTSAPPLPRHIRPLIITPGNYGTDFIAAHPALAALPCVKCSNFVGEAIDRAVLHGFTHILLVGHAGKFVKLAGGIMNTHSHTADCRMELLCAHAALLGAPHAMLKSVMQCATVDAALDVLDDANAAKASPPQQASHVAADAHNAAESVLQPLRTADDAHTAQAGAPQPTNAPAAHTAPASPCAYSAASVMQRIIGAAQQHIARRAGGSVTIGVVMFTAPRGVLGMSKEAASIIGMVQPCAQSAATMSFTSSSI